MIVSKKFPFPLWVPVRSGPQKRENSHRKVTCNITAEKNDRPEYTDSTDSECYCEDEDPKYDSSDVSEHDENHKPEPKASTFIGVKAFFEMLSDDECVDYPVNLENLTCQEAEASIILEARQGLLNAKRRKQEIAVAKQAEAARPFADGNKPSYVFTIWAQPCCCRQSECRSRSSAMNVSLAR